MATPLKRQFEVQQGTVIKKGTCSGCKKPVKLKVASSQVVYYHCPHCDEDAEPCGHHERWGHVDSLKMRHAWMIANGKIAAVKVPKDEAANLNRPPIRAVETPKPEPKPEPKKVSDYDEYGL